MRRSSGSGYGAAPTRNGMPHLALYMVLAAAVCASLGCRGPERTQVTVIAGPQPTKAAAPADGRRFDILPGAKLSPDGAVLATGVMPAVEGAKTRVYVNQVWFMDADTGQVLAMTDPGVQCGFYNWGPGNSYLMNVKHPGHPSQLVWARSPTEAYTTIAPDDPTLGDGIRGLSPHFDPQMKWVVVEASRVGAPEDSRRVEILAIALHGSNTKRIWQSEHFADVVSFVSNPRDPQTPMVLLGGQISGEAGGSEVAAIAVPSGAVLWRSRLSDEPARVGEIQPYGPGQVIVPVMIGGSILPGSGIHTEIFRVHLADGEVSQIADVPADCSSLAALKDAGSPSVFMASSWDVWQVGLPGSGVLTRKVADGSLVARPWGPIRRSSDGDIEAYFWGIHCLYRCHLRAGMSEIFWGRRLLSDDPPRVAR